MAQRGQSIRNLISFNAGELSPLLDARTDIDKYGKGCRQLQNALLETYGAVRRRPGTRFVAEAKFSNRKCRLLEFEFSVATQFIIELGHQYMRFYKDGAQVLLSGSPYEIVSPYLEADLYAVQLVQINDIVYLVHGSYAPRKLSRLADTNWTITEVDYTNPPLLDENITTTTITPSALTGNITLTASSAIFTSANVGSVYNISHFRADERVSKAINSTGSSGNLRISGSYRFRTTGTWSATIRLQRSYDNGTTFETIREFSSGADSNYDIEGLEPFDALYRINVTYDGYEVNNPKAILELTDIYSTAYVKVTAFTSTTVVSATVTTAKGLYGTTATRYWSEGAWSPRRGYPSAIAVFEQRICYAGTSHQPQTIRGSAVDDYENFKAGTDDTSAFTYTLAAQERNSILWLVAQRVLLVGTTAGEWSIGGSNDTSLTASNVTVRRQSNYGSSPLQARLINDVVLYTQRLGNKVREMTFSYEKEGYLSPDLTLLAEHITESGIIDTAFQRVPQSIYWGITAAGQLIGMTYERDQEVVGWHRHPSQGLFESISVVSTGAGHDQIWVAVKRQRMSGGVMTDYRYIEVFDTAEWTDKADCFYVDSGKTYSGGSTSTITGLAHLEGRLVSILANGSVQPNKTVANGQITLDTPATKAQVGLPYETIIEPMRLDSDPAAGVTQSQTKRIHEVSLRLNKSLGLTYGDGLTERHLTFRKTSDPMDSSPPLFTGDKEIEFDGDFDVDPRLIIKQAQPLPLCLLAINIKYSITGQ